MHFSPNVEKKVRINQPAQRRRMDYRIRENKKKKRTKTNIRSVSHQLAG